MVSKKKSISIVVLLITFLSSCKFMFAPVKEYLKEYTENAAIEKYYFVSGIEYPRDKNNVINLPSDNDIEIRFVMRNPQAYELNTSVDFVTPIDAIVAQNSANLNEISLKIPQNSLYLNEHGTDISATIKIVEPRSNRDFASFSIPLKCNTVPLKIKDTMLLIDNTSGSPTKGQYYLCFNMPGTSEKELGYLHKDLSKIKINNVEYAIVMNDDGTFSFPDSRFSTTEPACLSGATNYNGFTFNADTNPIIGQAVYFSTGEEISDIESLYNIEIIDVGGLSSITKASTQSEKLGLNTATNIDLSSLTGSGTTENPYIITQNNDGYGDIHLVIPLATVSGEAYDQSGTTINYEVYKKDGTPFSSGNLNGNGNIIIPNGESKVVARAQKDLYVSSDAAEFYCKVDISKVYVDAVNGNDTYLGTNDNAVNSINHAINMLTNKENPQNTIYILSNKGEDISISDEKLQLNILGVDKQRNPVNRKIIDPTSITITNTSTIENGFVLSLKNIDITSGSSTNGGGISIENTSGSSTNAFTVLNLEDCNIYGNESTLNGGGLYVKGVKTNIVNCNISENKAENGAGIYFDNSDVSISGSTLSKNIATQKGGALFVCNNSKLYISATVIGDKDINETAGISEGSYSNKASCGGGIYGESFTKIEITNSSVISYNLAYIPSDGTDDAKGGGIAVSEADGMLDINNSVVVQYNKAQSDGISYVGIGAGIYNKKVNLELDNITIKNNYTADTNPTEHTCGGGLYVTEKPATITSCTIENNKASIGAGLYINSETTLTNCTIDANSSDLRAGGIYTDSKTTLDKCNITNNIADEGSALYIKNETTLKDSTITRNSGTNTSEFRERSEGAYIDGTSEAKLILKGSTYFSSEDGIELKNAGGSIVVDGTLTHEGFVATIYRENATSGKKVLEATVTQDICNKFDVFPTKSGEVVSYWMITPNGSGEGVLAKAGAGVNPTYDIDSYKLELHCDTSGTARVLRIVVKDKSGNVVNPSSCNISIFENGIRIADSVGSSFAVPSFIMDSSFKVFASVVIDGLNYSNYFDYENGAYITVKPSELSNYLASASGTVSIMLKSATGLSYSGIKDAIQNTNANVNLYLAAKPEGTLSFEGCEKLLSIEILNDINISTIPANAFENCSSLVSVKLPKYVTTIEDNSFLNCTSLSNIEFSNVTSIGAYTFSNCSNLIDITLPRSLKTLGDNAFDYCTKLRTVTLQRYDSSQSGNDKITTQNNSFSGCELTKIYVPSVEAKQEYESESSWIEYLSIFEVAE